MAGSAIDLAGKVLDPLAEPAKAALVPPAKESGSYLTLKFRDRTRDERKRMLMAEMDEHFELKAYQEKKEREFAAFIEKVKTCHDEIPVEERIEPRESLLGPAIDAAEHFMGEEELRDMFAQRIASCYDGRKVERNHPAFTNILQGLSPLDAQNLKKIYHGDTFATFFIFVKCGWKREKYYVGYYDEKIQSLSEKQFLDPLESSSANSLERAGLVFVRQKTDVSSTVEGRVYGLTNLGFDFCSICLPDPPKKED